VDGIKLPSFVLLCTSRDQPRVRNRLHSILPDRSPSRKKIFVPTAAGHTRSCTSSALRPPSRPAPTRPGGGPRAREAARLGSARLQGRHRATQARVFEFFRGRPDLHTPVELSTAAHRDLCSRQLCALVREACVHPLNLMALRPADYFAVMEAADGIDISLGVSTGRS
jgi:hypothetical protein